MPSKYQEYRQMADTAERQLTSSYKSWTQFLRTAARLYKYPYNEQVMIHAQRPDATACAEYDFWNKKMGRFVRRGSTGIALIDTSGQKPQLRYVFDMADTGEREHSRPMHLWQFRAEHEDAVAAALERSYGVSGKDGIVEQMESAAAKLAREYWADYKRDILHNIDDSYLDGYDEFNTEMQFRNAAKVSITYMLMSRCGLEPEAYLEPEDFMPVCDFNTPAAVAALGTAVTGAAGIIADGITIALAVLRGMADFLTAVLRGEWDAAWAAMAGTVSTVWGRIVSIVQTAVSTVLGVVRSMVAAIAAAINGLLSAIGHAKSMAGSVLGGAGKLVSSQSALLGLGYAASVPVPALAQGAVIPPNRQFLAMLGDQTTGTNVEAPLATIKQAMAETLAGWQGSADGQPINIYIGEELLDSVIANSQNRRALRSGGR